MKKLIFIIAFLFSYVLIGQTTSTPVPYGSITVTGAVKVQGDNPSNGQIGIDTTGINQIIRTGDKAIITIHAVFSEPEPITVSLGTSIIPSGGRIISVSSDSPHRVDALVSIKKDSDNSFIIDQHSSITSLDIPINVQIIAEGYDNVDIQRRSRSPFELSNTQISDNLYASDVIVDAEFTGIDRNDDRSLVQYWFSSFDYNPGTGISGSLVRVKNGVNLFQGYSFPIGDITFVDGYADIESTDASLANIGLSKIKFRVSEENTNLSSGHSISETLFDSHHIFKNEIELGLKKEIVEIPSEIMGGLEDINGWNFKDVFKQFEVTSKYHYVPDDNYVRLNYFSLNRAANTIYTSLRIYTHDDVLIREISGSGNMTVSITDYSDVSFDYEFEGWRIRWNADFTDIPVTTTISGLTKEQAGFKIPAKNLDRTDNFFDSKYNTLGNTVNKRNFDISRFIKNIRIIPNQKEFLTENGSIKPIRVKYFDVSPTRYYLSFQIGTNEYTGVEVAPNGNTGDFDVEFVYPDFKAIATASWNDLTNYNFNYDALGNDSATLSQEVALNGYVESEMNANASGLTFNDYYQFGASTERVLPYLFKSIDWPQNTKIPRTNFLCIPDHNDEPQAVNKLLNWIKSDTAIELAIPTALLQGDFITTDVIDSAQEWEDKVDEWFDALPNDTPVLWCNGNHDLGIDGITDIANVPSDSIRKILIHDRLYNRLPANYQSATVRGTPTHSMYYYTDVPGTNVRVISLDQFEYPIVAGTGRPLKYSGTAIYDQGSIVAGFNVYYSEDQLNFLVNALETLGNDSTAILMTHIPIDSGSDANGELNALGNSNIALRAILQAFRDRVSTSVNVDAITEIPGFSVSMDFTSRTDSRMLYTYGHIHNFKHFQLSDAGNIHTVQCQAIGHSSPYISIEGNSVSNYGADIISIDEDKDEMYILRYGSRRTIKATGIPIGTDEHGFNFISRPLKLGN